MIGSLYWNQTKFVIVGLNLSLVVNHHCSRQVEPNQLLPAILRQYERDTVRAMKIMVGPIYELDSLTLGP